MCSKFRCSSLFLGKFQCNNLFLGKFQCSSLFLDKFRCSSLFLGKFRCSSLFQDKSRCISLSLGKFQCSSLFLDKFRCSSLFLVNSNYPHCTKFNSNFHQARPVEGDDAPAVAMEYKVHVDPGKEECYYQYVQRTATIYVSFQVLRGGDGMAGFAIRNPQGHLVHPYQWKAASDYQEVSGTGGYYGICVDNQFSRFAAKLVNLYITTFRYDQWEKYAQELKDIDVSAENCTQTLQGVNRRIQEILQHQQLSRGREARDYNLLLDNNTYVQYWSLAQIMVVIACFVVQVYFVKKLFETKGGLRGRI
nr:EOG090X0AV2 [Sida crystallina]